MLSFTVSSCQTCFDHAMLCMSCFFKDVDLKYPEVRGSEAIQMTS